MTPHFSAAELACKCGCGMLPEPSFMAKVERLREAWGRPLRVTSAARCPAHNAKVSGTGLNGPHTTGRALDVEVARRDALMLLVLALRLGLFTGIGVQQKGIGRFLHFDDLPDAPGQPRPTIWSY
jgi:zinc D-Ala-D-Ala carboxypeptidase